MLLEPINTVGIEMIRRLVEQENRRLLQQQPRERHAAPFTAGKMIDDGVAGRTTQRIHRHVHLRRDIPSAERVDLFLQLRLFVGDGILRRIVGRFGELVPTRIVGRREIREMLHALFDAGPHRGPGGEGRLLLQKAHRITRFKMHATVDLGIDPREDAHERGLAGAVQAEDSDLRAVVKREGDVAEDFLALDFLRDAEH